MATKNYPIGTKVIYNPPYTVFSGDERYRNKVGIIVVDSPVFPQCRFLDGKHIATVWRSLTPAIVKGQQLLFEFNHSGAKDG